MRPIAPRWRIVRQAPLVLAVLQLVAPAAAGAQEADLILIGARVWTGSEDRPRAEGLAVAGERILAVGTESAVLAHRGPETSVVELDGRFVAPGFIDNHTHFDDAGALLLGANLLDVSSEEHLVERLAEASARLPDGAWIVGGDWGAYDLDSDYHPDRSAVERATPGRPVLISKWNRSAWTANGLALEAAGAGCDWQGVECVDGSPTGRLTPAAGDRVRKAVPPKSMEQRLAEARVALERLAEHGVTTIHDITPAGQMRVFQELKERGELTVRVYARPTLDRWAELAAVGIRHGFGDDWLQVGGLKGFVDGIMGNSSARFYEPYLTSGERGRWRDMMRPEGNMAKLLSGAIATGHWPQVHAIGDEAIDALLDLFEAAMGENPGASPRLRIIHTQVLRDAEVARRMAAHGIVAEVQPFHAIDDMRWMEDRIGERGRWAYAFRTLEEAGVLLSFGSDWPGTNASWYPSNPLLGIYAAVTRQTVDGEPAGGWFPEERISLETALRAYTVHNAWAAGQEAEKGRLEPGLLADLVVLDRDPFEVSASELDEVRVLLTMVGGRVVHDRVAGER